MTEPVSVTPAVIKALAQNKDLDSLSDDVLNQFIQQARLIAMGDGFPKEVVVNDNHIPVLDEATEYMALHLSTLSTDKLGSGVVSEKVDVLERHYADVSKSSWLGSSKWGKLYLWLYKKYGAGQNCGIAVIQH